MSAGSHHRAAGLALIALFVLAQAALFAHQLLVPHRPCAEHGGELIHVRLTRAAPVPDAVAWSTAQPPEAPHRHDHCLAFTSRRQDVAATLEPSATPTAVEPVPALAPSPGEEPVSRARRLLYSPKSSPPV